MLEANSVHIATLIWFLMLDLRLEQLHGFVLAYCAFAFGLVLGYLLLLRVAKIKSNTVLIA